MNVMNKKGQTNTVGVTIAIILGIALIVFLIWGFSTNWSMFSSTSSAYAGKTNIDTVKQACQLQCNSGRTAEFCDANKDLIKADGSKISQYSCGELAAELGDSGFACDALCKFKKGVCEGGEESDKCSEKAATLEACVDPCKLNKNKIVKV